MPNPPVPLSRVQDTARWAATSRAVESAREDALFHDRFAERFVGDQLSAMLDLSRRTGGTWPIVTRTVLIDKLVIDAAAEGADAILNLAAGYDTRPYRLVLPPSLVWLDVDHDDVIARRREVLATEQPSCLVETHVVDLADEAARATLFTEVKARFRRVVVLTEGLLYYLDEAAALGLAEEIRALGPLRWIFDLHNAALRDDIRRRTGGALQGTAEMRFAPIDGPAVFERQGWTMLSTRASVQAAGGLGRLPFGMSLLAKLPAPKYGNPRWPWAGVCAAAIK